MNSPSESRKGAVCAVNPFPGVLQFQSSPYLKRFVMFDHSNGKGRVFFHSAVSQELFGSVHGRFFQGLATDREEKGDSAASNCVADKQIVEGAFSALPNLGDKRQRALLLQKTEVSTLPSTKTFTGTFIASQKPRVSESMSTNDGKNYTLDLQHKFSPHVAFETLLYKEEKKVSSTPPSAETISDGVDHNYLGYSSVRSKNSVRQRSEIADGSEPMEEDIDDLDALLSSDEEEDDDIRSTGHSPDESLGKVHRRDDDEVDDVEQNPCKKRRTSTDCEAQSDAFVLSDSQDSGINVHLQTDNYHDQSTRRQKIKSVVRALRRMIPGGTLLDTALVLDRTIMYVKDLRDRVDQLEVMRRQSQFYNCHLR